MNVIDSSCWLEYFAASPDAARFSVPIEDTDNLIVPTVVIYEVFKRLLQ
ncbi:MAG: VapC toxin family PIN domain ribonuclease, partial [Phycisphaerae bacterium]|nr:VapC toxin family PIN domain ribonuclease [Phycisphaerae bacterium]